MLRRRSDGETFGLAVGEFRPVISQYLRLTLRMNGIMRAHIEMLGDRALLYKNGYELLSYLLEIDKNYIDNVDWDRYSIKFSPQNVMKQFNDIFIK
jgi:hypothetical protein